MDSKITTNAFHWKKVPEGLGEDLTAQDARTVLDYNPLTGVFLWRVKTCQRVKANSAAGSSNSDGYLTIVVSGWRHKAHRLAWLYIQGSWPTGVIDHINGDKLDNRFENLRDVTQQANLQNVKSARKSSKTGLLGVVKAPTGWRAQITVGGKRLSLGTFHSPEGAHEAYLQAKRKVHIGGLL